MQSSKRRAFSSFLCCSRPCPEWWDRRREGEKEREKRKGQEWWMLCVCLSFPITELCLLKRRSDAFLISAFLTDEEQALTGGTVCFKHRLTSHSLFTSDTIHCSSRLLLCSILSPQLSWLVFILMFSYQMYSFPQHECVMMQCKEK